MKRRYKRIEIKAFGRRLFPKAGRSRCPDRGPPAPATRGARPFLVRIRVPNQDGVLRPGMFLRARLIVESRTDVVFVPERAVTRHANASYVMVLDGAIAHRRAVTLGLRADNGWEIEGVQAGETEIGRAHV